MSPDEIRRAIVHDPESDQLRLAYAKSCATTDPDHANFIRLQIEDRNLLRSREDSTKVSIAARELLNRPGHKERWAGPIADQVGWYDFGRGFVEDIEIAAAEFLEQGEKLYSLAPVRRLYLKSVAPVAEALFNSPLLDRIVCIGLEAQKLNDQHMALLAASPYLGHLGCLSLSGNHVTTAGLESLMRSKGLPSLKCTRFYGCPVYETELGDEYGDDQGQIVDMFNGLWPIEKRLGRKTWLHPVLDHGLGYTFFDAY